jgi:lysophospholipase L1-like esterase
MNRREFLLVTAAAALAAPSIGAAPATKPNTVPADVAWHDVRDWGVEGRGFADTDNYFDRLPARAKGVVRDAVWDLSRDASGMSTRFVTDATDIYLRYAILKPRLAMAHMPASGVSGLDIYGQTDDRKWQWLASHRPSEQTFTGEFQKGIAPGRRTYLVNLPLYNGVKSLEIGIPKGASFEPVAPRREKPILFHGTSITQGGCASRPGMSFVNILGRRLDRPVLNLGFSGNGKMELEVARFLAELDPAVFVFDCVANTEADQIAERAVPFVKLLRQAHPKMPILIMDERAWANSPLVPELGQRHKDRSAAIRRAYDDLVAVGEKNLAFRTAVFLGEDGEATVDGSHPTDLGMVRYADAIEPDLKKLLGSA